MNLLKKIIFILKKPTVILVTGKGRSYAKLAISQVLKPELKKRNILIFESAFSEPKDVEKFNFLLRKSQLPILVVTHTGDIPADKDFFTGERKDTNEIRKLAGILPARGFLILNFDDEAVREIKNETAAHPLTYGFQERADLKVSDINVNLDGTNFKINYQGNIVPFWLKKLFGKEQVYSVLTAISVGVIKDINLVEISQLLKDYKIDKT